MTPGPNSSYPSNRRTCATVIQTLEHWQKDNDLAGVREPEGFAKLSQDERELWRALWNDVDSVLKKARGTPP